MKIMLEDVLKEMREKAGLKQSEVAEYVGVTPQTYMKWENGKNEPKASNIKKLAEILKVSETELCRGERFHKEDNPIEFMKKVAQYINLIDEVSFTSILFNCVEDKSVLLRELDKELKKLQGFSVKDMDHIGRDEIYAASEYKKSIDQHQKL